MGVQLCTIYKDDQDLMTKTSFSSNFQTLTLEELNVRERRNETQDAERTINKS